MPPRTRTKKDTTALDLIDALADVIASRVAAKINEAQKPPAMPERVPIWLMGPKPPQRRRRQKTKTMPPPSTPEPRRSWTKAETEAMADQAIRGAGGVRMGEPGYQALLERYLVRKRVNDSDLHVRAQMRRAARLIARLVEANYAARDRAMPTGSSR